MPTQPIPAFEIITELLFPTLGINLATEFELQPPFTTSLGVNVRGYEVLTQRGRGGQRPGLTKWVPAAVNGPHLIQHLNYIVDPTEAALLGADGPPAGPTVPDPRTGFPVRVGGTGAPGRRPRGGAPGSPPPPPPVGSPPPPPAPISGNIWIGKIQFQSGGQFQVALHPDGTTHMATPITGAIAYPDGSYVIGVVLGTTYYLSGLYFGGKS